MLLNQLWEVVMQLIEENREFLTHEQRRDRKWTKKGNFVFRMNKITKLLI